MSVLQTARLTIRDQNELLNQIAGTYKDFYRAAMEYIDNAIDAAEIQKREGAKFKPELNILIDSIQKKISFVDNCGGMSPKELCELISEVGRSKKKTVPWANGQFGFGIHAFRAFAKTCDFMSKKKDCEEAKIVVDRNYDETTDVDCIATNGKQLDEYGTKVTISKFDAHIFKKSDMFHNLVSEIQHHFDDVLRSGLIKIYVKEDNSKPYECHHFDFAKLSGTPLKQTAKLDPQDEKMKIDVDLRILEKPQDDRLPVLTNKQRRIQSISDLKSYKQFLRSQGRTNIVWSNPFIVGFVEINDVCSPNITRDDLKDSPNRELLFTKLLDVQIELEKLADDLMNKKSQDSFKKLGKVMSDCLARILKGYKLQFESTVPDPITKQPGKTWTEESGDSSFGGDQPGGGGPGPNQTGGGGRISQDGNKGPGDNNSGGGEGDQKKGQKMGDYGEVTSTSSGPQIDFQNHAGGDRVIDLGSSLIINTQHPDFIQRNPSKIGKIRLDARLINYVSIVIAPPLVHQLFAKKGKYPTALEVGNNVVNLSTQLEKELMVNMSGQEIETT